MGHQRTKFIREKVDQRFRGSGGQAQLCLEAASVRLAQHLTCQHQRCLESHNHRQISSSWLQQRPSWQQSQPEVAVPHSSVSGVPTAHTHAEHESTRTWRQTPAGMRHRPGEPSPGPGLMSHPRFPHALSKRDKESDGRTKSPTFRNCTY